MSRILDIMRGLTGNASTNDVTATNTPPSSDNSKALATTEWAKLGFAVSLAANGYIKLPSWLGGMILQWGGYTLSGVTSGSTTTTAITFPQQFPTLCSRLFVQAQTNSPGGVNCSGGNYTATGANCYAYTSAPFATLPIIWVAIGW